MSEKVLLLNGDGVGPSVVSSAEQVLQAMADSVEIVHMDIGRSAYEKTGQYLPHDTRDALDECHTVISGPAMSAENTKGPVETLMVQLDLFARVRHYRTIAPDLGVEGMDVVLWSSNAMNSDITEVEDLDGINLNKYVRNTAYNKMMTLALSDVEIRKAKRITCLTKPDFFPISSAMFDETFSSLFPSDVYETRKLNVKDWVAHVVKNPLADDCVLCVDLYSQLVAGVLGGLTGYDHLAPRCLIGDDYKFYKPCSLPTFPDVPNEYVNPTASILSVASILRDMGLSDKSQEVWRALVSAYMDGDRTPDVGGELTTEEFTERLVRRL